MRWNSKSEFGDPTVRNHRKKAAERIPREAEEVSSILRSVVDGLERPVDQRISVLCSEWKEIAGIQIAQHSEPGFIKNFALHIFVDHPGWMSDLVRTKQMILMKVQRKYPNLKIRRLYFILEHK